MDCNKHNNTTLIATIYRSEFYLQQCFSTGVPWNLRVPPVVSKGSAGPPVHSKKKLNCILHLRPLDAFSRLLVGPKCICSQDSAPNPIGGAYSTPPDPLADGERVDSSQQPVDCQSTALTTVLTTVFNTSTVNSCHRKNER